jgi:hypothetical protein
MDCGDSLELEMVCGGSLIGCGGSLGIGMKCDGPLVGWSRNYESL